MFPSKNFRDVCVLCILLELIEMYEFDTRTLEQNSSKI